MALEFDGFEAWQAIAESPDTFASLRADAAKSARAALVKYLKARSHGIPDLRAARKALGKNAFRLLIEGMKDTEVRALVARLDTHHPELKTADPVWLRQHFLQLVRGEAEPAKKSTTGLKSIAPGPSVANRDGDWFTSAGAVRKR